MVKLQYTTPRRFRVGSARSANKSKQTQNTNPKYEQTQNTKGFRSAPSRSRILQFSQKNG